MFKLLLFDSLIILYIVFDNLCDNFSSKLDVAYQKRSEILERSRESLRKKYQVEEASQS